MVILPWLPWQLTSKRKNSAQAGELDLVTAISWRDRHDGFSSYLLYLLAFKIKAVCLYCLASAAFSFSLLVLTIIGRTWEDIGQILFTAIALGGDTDWHLRVYPV